MRLFLIRHGQTAWNTAGRAQGHTDEPLDECGLWQAQQLAQTFQNGTLDLVLTSDLQRSRMTAEVLADAANAPIEVDPLLRERSFGELEGHPYIHVREQLEAIAGSTGLASHQIRPPSGESIEDVWNRLIPVRDRLTQSTLEDVAIVTHGGAGGLLLAQLLSGTLQTGRCFRFGNTALTELLRRPGGHFELTRYADVSHLSVPSSPMIDAYHRVTS